MVSSIIPDDGIKPNITNHINKGNFSMTKPIATLAKLSTATLLSLAIISCGGSSSKSEEETTKVEKIEPTPKIVEETKPQAPAIVEPPKPAKPKNYTRSADGIVTDKKTGLEWQDDLILKRGKNFADAKAYCEALTLGGKNDWRMPSLREVISIIQFENGKKPFLPEAFENVANEIHIYDDRLRYRTSTKSGSKHYSLEPRFIW